MAEKEVSFIGTIVRKVWDDGSDMGFKIYALDVDEEQIEKQQLKRTKYGNVTITGTLHELGEGLEYNIKAVETNGKNGYSYKVKNISRNRPKNANDMYVFLKEILTPLQAEALYNAYPNIVEKVINDDLDDIDLNKTKRIKEYTFNVIKRKIIENYALAEMVVEFKGILSMTMINKLYSKYSSIKVLRHQLKEDPYMCLSGLPGIGFKKADAIAQELNKEKVIDFGYDLVTSPQRCLAACMYLLEDNETSNGNTRMDLRELRKQIIKLVPACCDHFVEALKDEHIYYNKDKMVVALRKTYETEKYIADRIKEALSIKNHWNIDCSKYEIVDDFELTDEQKQLTRMVCNNQIMILNGSAGTGKSASTQSVINMCKEHNKTFILLSPTGRAAQVLSEYTNEPASTIHRGLDFNPKVYPDTGGWGYNEDNPLTVDFVLCDEFSMTDIWLFKHLIEAINFQTTKLLLVGDSAQIPSISAGNLLHDFIASKVINVLTLQTVFRYSGGGLLTVATDIRNGKNYLGNPTSVLTKFGDDYTFLNVPDNKMKSTAIELYKKIMSKEYQERNNLNLNVEDVQIITAKNVGEYGTVILNQELQKIANKNYGSSCNLKIGDTTYYGVYTSQIESNLNSTGSYKLKEGDYVNVSVKNTNTTISQMIKGVLYSVTGDQSYVISAQASGSVVSTGY